MPKSYTPNQTGAIACALASNLWGLTAHGVGWMLNQTSLVYSVIIIVAWLLLPFMIILRRHAFIAAIFLWILAMCYLLITPSLLGTIPWQSLTEPLFHSTYFIWYLISVAGTYFSYRSWKELLKK